MFYYCTNLIQRIKINIKKKLLNNLLNQRRKSKLGEWANFVMLNSINYPDFHNSIEISSYMQNKYLLVWWTICAPNAFPTIQFQESSCALFIDFLMLSAISFSSVNLSKLSNIIFFESSNTSSGISKILTVN